jgi:hypothetical protein
VDRFDRDKRAGALPNPGDQLRPRCGDEYGDDHDRGACVEPVAAELRSLHEQGARATLGAVVGKYG